MNDVCGSLPQVVVDSSLGKWYYVRDEFDSVAYSLASSAWEITSYATIMELCRSNVVSDASV